MKGKAERRTLEILREKLRKLVKRFLKGVMLEERELYLEENLDDKVNGHYNRKRLLTTAT